MLFLQHSSFLGLQRRSRLLNWTLPFVEDKIGVAVCVYKAPPVSEARRLKFTHDFNITEVTDNIVILHLWLGKFKIDFKFIFF